MSSPAGSPATAGSPGSKKSKEGKQSKLGAFYSRSTYAALVCFLSIAAYCLNFAPITSYKSASEPISADGTRWTDVSPSGGNCTCVSTHVSYCAETADSFEATYYLGIVVMFSEVLVMLLLSWELGAYGLYGGSHTITRVALILTLLAFATQILSIISWVATYASKHCGDASFQEQGAALGWPFFLRALEMVLMGGYVFYTISMFPKTNRGPPSMPLLVMAVFYGLTAVTTFAPGWMTHNGLSYSTFAACSCGSFNDACSGMTAMLALGLAFEALGVVAGLVTVFFTVLRAVDNEGATLKFATVSSGITLLCQVIGTAGAGAAASNSCGAFENNWPVGAMIAAVLCQFLFLVMNSLYMRRFGEEGDVPMSVYQATWWTQLKDPRTLAHESREDDEQDDDDSEEDDADLDNPRGEDAPDPSGDIDGATLPASSDAASA